MTIVRIEEYKRSDCLRLSNEQIHSLRQLAGKIFLEAGNESGVYVVRADSWIGKFTIPGMVFDIVPKIGPVNALKMFLVGDGEAHPEMQEALNRASSENDFWDLAAELLMYAAEAIIRGGIRRQYVEFDRNSDFVRGQVLIEQDLLENAPVRTGTFCRFTELTPDIAVNQAIVWGLDVIGQGASPEMAHRIRLFARRLDEVSLLPGTPTTDHQNEQGHYRTALFLVNLIRASLQTASSTFGLSGFGLMMDMNQVFEGFVRSMIKTSLADAGLLVPDKRSTRRPLCEGVILEPDFLVYSQTNPIAVCDCKYKIDWRFLNSDVYQMLAYLEGFAGVRHAFVFHPESELNRVSVERVEFPRSGTLFRIGIPIDRLLDGTVWDDVGEALFDALGPLVPSLRLVRWTQDTEIPA